MVIIDNFGSSYTLPTAGLNKLGGVKTTSTVTSTSGLTACPIISGVPYYKDTTYTALKNPNAITISLNGTSQGAYDGSSAKSINITPASIGAATSSHTHTKSQITDFPSTLANPNAIVIKLNGGTTEGTNMFTYTGSAAKTINITPSSIGASASSHTHNYAGSDSAGGPANEIKSSNRTSTDVKYNYIPIIENYSLQYSASFILKNNVGTTDKIGESTLILGNSTVYGKDGNQRGTLIMYGASSSYTILKPNDTNTVSIFLPSSSGTLALNTRATQSADGLMSSSDKLKVDGLVALTSSEIVNATPY